MVNKNLQKILILSTSIFISCSLFGQNNQANTAGQKIFDNICTYIVAQNDTFLLQKRYENDFSITYNPLTNENSILQNNANKILDDSLLEFKKYNFQQQYRILYSRLLPIFPLKDTVFILDPDLGGELSFFNGLSALRVGKYYFVLCHSIDNQDGKKCVLQLYKMSILKDYLMISFSINSKEEIQYWIGLNDSNFNIKRTSVVAKIMCRG
jgi:hypothetical protein